MVNRRRDFTYLCSSTAITKLARDFPCHQLAFTLLKDVWYKLYWSRSSKVANTLAHRHGCCMFEFELDHRVDYSLA